ncbi:MAG TPA: ribosome maturation factor RimM [Solirubrobacteraceae bacterium]|jgi:16S rRNA processing protein RimM
MDDGQWLLAGRVGRPHGLDGSFHVAHASPRLLDVGMSVRVGSESRVITRRAGQESRPIIALEGCEDRLGAQALQGQELRVPRGAAPALPEDEWWAEDLEGCTVRDGQRVVGTVARMMSLPSVDVLEVNRPDGEPALLVPLVGDAVLSVDVEQKEIQIDLQFLD